MLISPNRIWKYMVFGLGKELGLDRIKINEMLINVKKRKGKTRPYSRGTIEVIGT